MAHTHLYRDFRGAIVLLLLILIPLSCSSPYTLLPATAQATQNRKAEGDRLLKEGVQQLQTGQFEAALQSWQQALAIYQNIQNHQGRAKTLGYIGNAYFHAGQYRQIEKLFRQELDSNRKIGDVEEERLILEVMRSSFYQEWRFQAGYAAQAVSGELQKRLKNKGISWQETLELSQLNLFLSQQLLDQKQEALSWHSMGWAYRNLGQYFLALESYQKALTIAKEVSGDFQSFVEAFFLIDVGIVYSDLAQHDKALNYFYRSLNIENDLSKTVTEHFALNHIGLVYKHLRQYKRALKFFQEALSKLGQGFEQRNILSNIGSVYFELRDYAKALEFYQKALKLPPIAGEPGVPGFTLSNIGLSYEKMGNYAQALEAYRKALALFREINDRPGERIILSNIGILLERQNQPELAIVFYKESVNITETIRHNLQKLSIEEQKAYTESVARTYRALANLLIEQGRIGEAQQVLERLKVQELNDFTKGTRAPTTISEVGFNPVETQIKDKYTSLIAFGGKFYDCEQQQPRCSQYRELRNQYDNLSEEFQAFVKQIKKQLSDNRLTQVDQSTQDFQTSADRVVTANPNSIVIYPLVLADKTRLLWATKGGVLSKTAVCPLGEEKLYAKVAQFRTLISQQGNETQLKAVSKELYDCLIQPIEGELTANQIHHLIFVPDRATNYIPISALFDGQHYLIQRFAVSNVLSAKLTDSDDRLQSPAQTPVLALGLSQSKGNFSALPNVPAELQSIVKQKNGSGIYPGDAYLNQSFTKETLEDNIRGHRIIHIATHGEFKPENPRSSYFLLGTGEPYPIPEVQTLRDLKNIHLVVLSACETALGGADSGGLEVSGISSFFMGDRDRAKAVLASLWKVNDASTTLLMQQFYQNLATGKMTKAEALRQAQLSLLQGKLTAKNTPARADVEVTGSRSHTSYAENFSHPYYWAPFILIGNSL